MPEGFLESMRGLLGPEYGDFTAELGKARHVGILVNALRVSADAFAAIMGFEAERVPWCGSGYRILGGGRPGGHFHHSLGLYYVQEPSAMVAAELLAPRGGEAVLDLCAAPGGKSFQMAAAMGGEGVLVANDVNPKRVHALIRNMALSGARNAVITNESPERLCGALPGFFDKVLVDAPCSGEGMMRKGPEAAKAWGTYRAGRCAAVQSRLLACADRALKVGGEMLYSTCTYNPVENESVIAGFLEGTGMRYEAMDSRPDRDGLSPGRPEWVGWVPGGDARLGGGSEAAEALRKAVRIWPHKAAGEGHFAARLRKLAEGGGEPLAATGRKAARASGAAEAMGGRDGAKARGAMWAQGAMGVKGGGTGRKGAPSHGFAPCDAGVAEAFARFAYSELEREPRGALIWDGGTAYLAEVPPDLLERLDGIRVLKVGIEAGRISGGAFRPAHELAFSPGAAEFRRTLDYPSADPDYAAMRYLRGESPPGSVCGGGDGYLRVTVDSFPAGLAKASAGAVKGMYPPSWRRMG